ncbi:MAG: PIG-L family deacetylase [Chloroflexota bacterium]
MRWIYLSPHLDDAVFSAGGLIHEQTRSGDSVEIWTIMCGDPKLSEYSPFAQALHSIWGFSSGDETVRRRREEDTVAASLVGAKAVHFDFLDCIYRRDKNGNWLYSEISVPPHDADADLPAQIASVISARLEPDDKLVCQLGLGSHVDHVLVRRAAELLNRPLRYDIDIPYWCYKPHEVSVKAAGMNESTLRITEPSLTRWIEAALAYKSQFPALGDRFDTPAKVTESIRTYWSELEGIRLLQFG